MTDLSVRGFVTIGGVAVAAGLAAAVITGSSGVADADPGNTNSSSSPDNSSSAGGLGPSGDSNAPSQSSPAATAPATSGSERSTAESGHDGHVGLGVPHAKNRGRATPIAGGPRGEPSKPRLTVSSGLSAPLAPSARVVERGSRPQVAAASTAGREHLVDAPSTPSSPLSSTLQTATLEVPRLSTAPTPAAVPLSVPAIGASPAGTGVANAKPAAVAAPNQPQPPAAMAPTTTDPLRVVTAEVSELLGSVLNPFAVKHGPAAPADSPAAWSLLAFARREFGTREASLSSVGAAPAAPTEQDLATVPQLAAVPTQAVQNSLTYTPAPDLFDQLTVSGLRLARDIFGFFGLDFGGIVGSLLASQDPPFFLTFGLTAQQTQYEISPGNVWKVWTFTPPNPTGKTVIAIHGGGFIIEPTIQHWIDYTQMARDTGATVVVPMYPLATTPAGSILNVQPVMADFIAQQIDRYGAENVSIHADSGGVTHAFGAVRELILRGDSVPASMVLLSGQADFSGANPDIRLIDDPFFDPDNVDFYLTYHTFDGITEGKDPRISPLFMETEVLQALPPTTIYVGEVEFLLPDNLLLYQRAVNIGAPISMVVGTGLPHDWALGGLRTYSQTPVVRPDIYRQLGLTMPPGVELADVCADSDVLCFEPGEGGYWGSSKET